MVPLGPFYIPTVDILHQPRSQAFYKGKTPGNEVDTASLFVQSVQDILRGSLTDA